MPQNFPFNNVDFLGLVFDVGLFWIGVGVHLDWDGILILTLRSSDWSGSEELAETRAKWF